MGFSASRLSFEITGEGVAIDPASGVLSIPADGLDTGITVTITATDAAGSRVGRYHLTLTALAASEEAPALRTAPALAGSAGTPAGTAAIGATVTLDPGAWSGTPAPSLAAAWLLDGADVAGATGLSYVPQPADDGRALSARVTATNAAGSAAAETAACAIVHAAPTVVAPLADVAADAGAAPVAVEAAAAFAGAALTFAVKGVGATIDSATGVVTIATQELLEGERITVTATNSGGSAEDDFLATVRATPPVCGKAPALAGALAGAPEDKGVIGTPATLDPGAWDGVPAPELAIAWLLDGAVVEGAAGTSYTPVAADDGKRLSARVTAKNAAGEASAETAALAVVHAAPTVVAPLADVGLFVGDAPAVVEAAAAFEGNALVFAVEGGGATVDAKGRLSVPATAAGSATVSVTATNSGGSARVSFGATVSVRIVPPVLVLAPVLAGAGRIGAPVTVSAGSWSGVPAPSTRVAWLIDGAAIAGAVGTSYTPVAADDGKALSARVTATNAGGSAETVTAALSISYAPPVAKGGLEEEIFDLGSGVETVAAGADFTGEDLSFAVSGAGATIDARTGVVSIPTDRAVQATVWVTATNSGGSARSSFQVTVEAEDVPFALEAEDVEIVTAIWRPEAQETWFTPVVRFPGLEGETVDAIEWTTSGKDPVPETEYEVVAKVGTGYQLYMRDSAKNAPGASPRVDYSVFKLDETKRREALRFRWRRTAEGPWSAGSSAVSVPPVAAPEAQGVWLPASPRTKEAYEAGIVGSQGQQYQRCRTWNLGIIDPAKRGWVITQQDENSCRLTKNGNAGTDNDPVLWGFPRLDGYHGGKSGGLYLNTDDNAGSGLFVGVTGYYYGLGFGAQADMPKAIGVYVGDGTLNWVRKVAITRPSGPGPYVSGSSGPKKAFTAGNGTQLEYFGNAFDRQGNFVARRPQVPEMQQCTVFKTTKALLDADLAYASGTKAAVYADSTQGNRAVYTKTGASGSGSWSKTIELLTDAQRPIYVLEQHGDSAGVTYIALFKSTDGGASFTFVRELPIATYAGGSDGIYYVLVAPNGDVMLAGKTGAFLSTDEGANFTSKFSREVSDAHFFGGSSTTVSGARVGDASANSNGGVYATTNVRSTALAKPTGAGGAANAGLPSNFNVWDMACAPTDTNLLLVTTDTGTAYRSTDGGRNWGLITSEKTVGDEAFRFTFSGSHSKGHSGFLFCPTNADRVVGFTFQTVTQSIDGGASFQGRRALFFDGMHNRGTGTGPLTGADPWKKLVTVSQDSLVATWLDGMNWMQRCRSGTGDDAFKNALEAAGAGNKPYVSGASGILLPNNRVVCCTHRNQPGQTNVMVVLHERQADGSYPNLTVRDLSGKKTRGTNSAWSLADPDGYAFIGRWGVGNVGAAVGSITFDDHSGHEYIDQMLVGGTPVSYWGDFASGSENGTAIYLSDHAKGLNNQTTAWHSTTGSYPCRAICIDPHTPERVLYVSNNDRSVIREVKRVGGSLVDSTLKDSGGNAVDLATLIAADFASRIPGGATLPASSFTDITQLISDPNMAGLFYAVVGVQGVPNLWMTVDNGLNWTNAADNLPRTLWFGSVHPLTGDVLMDSSLGRHVLPPPKGYPNVPYKGALSAQLESFYGRSARPPVF